MCLRGWVGLINTYLFSIYFNADVALLLVGGVVVHTLKSIVLEEDFYRVDPTV